MVTERLAETAGAITQDPGCRHWYGLIRDGIAILDGSDEVIEVAKPASLPSVLCTLSIGLCSEMALTIRAFARALGVVIRVQAPVTEGSNGDCGPSLGVGVKVDPIGFHKGV